MTRYLKDGTATGVSVHSVRSLGTVEGLETFEVWEHGGSLQCPTLRYLPHERYPDIKLPMWEVEAGPGWLHVTGPARETVQAYDGIRRRVRPGYVLIGQDRRNGYAGEAYGVAQYNERLTRAYSLHPTRVCGGDTGTHDDRCGRTYGHAGPCDWAD